MSKVPGLSLVHEVDYALHLPAFDVFDDDDGMLARVLHEDLLEVGAEKEDKHH